MLRLLALMAILVTAILFLHGLQQDVLMPATLVEAAATVVPPWASPEFYAWLARDAGESDFSAGQYVDLSSGPMSVGALAYDGYRGLASFACTPLVLDHASYITDCFGSPRSSAYNHSGLDIGTDRRNGAQVISPMGGKVVFVGLHGGWGFTLLIENQGYQILLAHAQDVLVSVGQEVQAGQVVMLSGGCLSQVEGRCADPRDGSSSGPHLHFEVRHCAQEPGGETQCLAVDPQQVNLPGQSMACNWFEEISDASRNVSCAQGP